jgi:hypothetical protein
VTDARPAHDRRRGAASGRRSDVTGCPGFLPSRSSVEARRELLEQFQVVEVHLQTAASLESLADRSANATFAAVLHDRAEDHRRTATGLLENLVQRGLVTRRAPRRR